MFRKIIMTAFTLCLIIVLAGCTGETAEADTELSVAVSILPQKYFVEKIIGDSISIIVIVPPGASPATYEPTPSDMRRMADVDVWFTIGVAFETAWLPRFTGANPNLNIQSTIENVERLPIDRYSISGHEASSEHSSRSHGSSDPHVWLSPELVRIQAAAIADELSLIDTSKADEYTANLKSFNLEIDSLQSRIHELIDSSHAGSFIVFHPAWGYFADEFDLVQIPVETAGNEPSPGEMSLLIDYARENEIHSIFVSPQFSISSAEAIASEINAEVLYIDPLAEDWGSNLYSVAEYLTRIVDS